MLPSDDRYDETLALVLSLLQGHTSIDVELSVSLQREQLGLTRFS
jgi:hypothetical protein